MKHLFGQRSKRFLKSHWEKDDEWIVVIDELNEQLHEDSVKNISKIKPILQVICKTGFIT